MNKIEEYIKLALIGTDRISIDTVNSEKLNDISVSLKDSDKEENLLSMSGVIFKYNLAGSIPEILGKVNLSVAEVETMNNCNDRLTWIISDILIRHSGLLTELLENMIKTRKVFPEILLPRLFEEGLKLKDLQQMIVQVAGKRGIWLAKQNQRWNYIFDQDKNHDEIWNHESCSIFFASTGAL